MTGGSGRRPRRSRQQEESRVLHGSASGRTAAESYGIKVSLRHQELENLFCLALTLGDKKEHTLLTVVVCTFLFPGEHLP